MQSSRALVRRVRTLVEGDPFALLQATLHEQLRKRAPRVAQLEAGAALVRGLLTS